MEVGSLEADVVRGSRIGKEVFGGGSDGSNGSGGGDEWDDEGKWETGGRNRTNGHCLRELCEVATMMLAVLVVVVVVGVGVVCT